MKDGRIEVTVPDEVLDEVLYQATVDEEFRERLLRDPRFFGVGDWRIELPVPVEPLDRSLLDLASGAQFTAQCQTTCSSGPLTIICDGTTK
jgi:hypothetical protein